MRAGDAGKIPCAAYVLMAASLLPGCATSLEQDGGDRPTLFFPSPPTPPRVQFLSWASGAAEIEPVETSFSDFILDHDGEKNRPRINKPFGLAVREGVLYVCDTKNICICRFDFENRKFSVFGHSGPGKLRKPINIVIDPLGYKFVADSVRNQIVVFDEQDRFVKAYGVPAPARIVDVAIFGNELFVVDNDKTCQIVVLDRSTGEVLRSFGGPGHEPGQFAVPNSICADPEGFLYVSDPLACRIQKLTRDGKPVWVRGTPGYHLGQFGRPRGLRIGPDGIIYVVDAATEIVQMLDKDGNVLMHFGGPGVAPGAMLLPSSIALDKSSIRYFSKYVHDDFEVDYLMFVANQYGPHLINIYAFGSFPKGYQLSEVEVTTLPRLALRDQPGRPGAVEESGGKLPEQRDQEKVEKQDPGPVRGDDG